MSSGSRRPVLVVGDDAALRRDLGQALAGWRSAVEIEPAELARRGAVDAPAAFAVLADGSAEALASLDPLRGHPVGGALVLAAAAELDDAALERAVARLAPREVVVEPWRRPVLEHALRQVDPEESDIPSARHQHRPARALLGVSSAIRDLLAEIRSIAPTDVAALVLGETGSGKELVARAIHEESRRSAGPFVAINCAAIPEQLLEAELFGYRRGAFTGAERDKAGLFEAADGGTLFLDEVADLPLTLQAKLLRVIETREVRPLGATETTQVDVRIVSATHQDLEDRVADDLFRQDLFYRLNTVLLLVPPLRRRKVDIPFLAQHFAEEFGELHARRITLGEDFLERLADHDFPGNVRELRNAVERAIALAKSGDELGEEDLPSELRRMPKLMAFGTLRDRVAQVELQAIREALERFDGNRTRVAEALGLSRQGLRQKMRRLGIDESD